MSDYWIFLDMLQKEMGIKTWRDLNKHKAKFATIETGGKGRLNWMSCSWLELS